MSDFWIMNEAQERFVAIVDGSFPDAVPLSLADFLSVMTQERHAIRREEYEEANASTGRAPETSLEDVLAWADRVGAKVADGAGLLLVSDREIRLACAIQNIVALHDEPADG